jgi:hypothetical protein
MWSPVPGAVPSKAYVCGCSIAEIRGTNPAEGMDVRFWSSMQACMLDGHLHRVTCTRRCIDAMDSPDDENEPAGNM